MSNDKKAKNLLDQFIYQQSVKSDSVSSTINLDVKCRDYRGSRGFDFGDSTTSIVSSWI